MSPSPTPRIPAQTATVCSRAASGRTGAMLAVTATAAGLRPPLGERVGLFHCHNHRHLMSRSPGPRQSSFAAPFSVFQESHTVGPVLKAALMQAQGIRQSQPQGHAHIPGEVKMHLPEFRVWVPALCSKALTPHVSLNQDRANSTNASFSLGSWGAGLGGRRSSRTRSMWKGFFPP